MSDFYCFEGASSAPTQASAERYIALFTPNFGFDTRIAEDTLTNFLHEVRAPGHLYLIGFEPCRESLRSLACSTNLRLRLPLGAGDLSHRIECLSFSADGTLRHMDNSPVDRDLVRMIRNDGLRHMFNKHKGMVQAKPNTHFVKPSGDHADRFIRVANVLRQGEEIAFIAAWLLPHIKPSTTYIQCDSATIACVAYALVNLKRTLDPAFVSNPRVRSFGSYRGLEDEFSEPGTSLVLISASTTGRLTEKLIECAVQSENIVTLYSLPAEQLVKSMLGTTALCDLDWKPDRTPRGYEKIRNQAARLCSYCLKDHSHRIHISPDTFIPEPPEVQSHTIAAIDAPAELKDFLDLCAGQGAVRCYYRAPDDPKAAHEIHLNAACLFAGKSYASKFSVDVGAQLGTQPELVVRLRDEASKVVTDALLAECLKRGFASPEVIDYQQAVLPQVDFSGRTGPIWVVTSAMVGGRRLSDISRKLRGFNGEIIYLCAVTRTSAVDHLKELRSNLAHRAGGAHYPFISLANIHLPRPNQRNAPWDQEFSFLKKLRVHRGPLPRPIEERFELLRSGLEDGELGLSKSLFWKSPKGEPLALRANFAFYAPAKGVRLSQAEVYLVITTILHKLRTGPKPLQLLSPGNFDRFNDGVIQAALLRAARPEELNYALSEFHSDYLCDLMCFMLHEPMGNHSEALPEFIWALVDQKMRLTYHDHKRVLDEIEKCVELPAYLKQLAHAAPIPEESGRSKQTKSGRKSTKRKVMARSA